MGRFEAPAWNARPQLLVDGLALTVADIQGLWAVLFVYCTEPKHEGGLEMHVGTAGMVMLVQGLLSTCLGPFVGRLHDRSSRKRLLFGIMPVSLLIGTWLTINFTQIIPIVIVALCLQGIAGGAYPPGICAISFGVVGSAEFPARASRNEMWKHVGAVLTAGIFPILLVGQEDENAWVMYFGVMACMYITTAVLLCGIRESDIVDHENGKLMAEPGMMVGGPTHTVVPLRELLLRTEIILFMGAVSTFHLANAAMLPQLGYKLDTLYNNNSTQSSTMSYLGQSIELDGKNSIAMATIISQVVMIPIAKFSGTLANTPWIGSKKLLMFGVLALFVRGLWIATAHHPETLLWSSILDGVAAGIFGVCAILLMSDLTENTGQFAAMQGMVATCLGLGSSMSHGIAGWISETWGVDTAMFFLATLTLVPMLMLLGVPDRRCKWGVQPMRDEFDEKKSLLHSENSNPIFEVDA
eukprot:m.435912 g.435912  ORF g.435912 m.435912 type:complete len:468 (+) comp17911_c0_seq1:122-1525(+)